MPPTRLRIEFPTVAETTHLLTDRLRDDLIRRPPPPTTFEVLRGEDLLHFVVELRQLVVDSDGRLRPPPGVPSGLLVFHFQPQHLFEPAVAEGSPPPPMVPTWLAMPSRVVIEVSAGKGVQLSTAGLLDALAGEMRLSATARGDGPTPGPVVRTRLPTAALADLIQPRTAEESARFGRVLRKLSRGSSSVDTIVAGAIRALRGNPSADLFERARVEIDAVHRAIEELQPIGRAVRPARPTDEETAIEIPFRLLMAPTPGNQWTHRVGPPVASPGHRVELWHSRLAVVDDHGGRDESFEAADRQARAMWSRDSDTTVDPAVAPLKTTISRDQRQHIVSLTSDGSFAQTHPVQVRRWMLSSQGGWLDVHGAWKPNNTGLLGWDHRATLGRDQFVRIEEMGWLWPFGNLASLITISERKLRPEAPDKAFLWQRQFIRVLEPYKQWNARNPREERGKPFHSIEIKLKETPDVTFWRPGRVPGDPHGARVIPVIAGKAFRFPIAAVDHDDQIVTFDTPMIFTLQPSLKATDPPPPPPDETTLGQYYAQLVGDLGEDAKAQLRGQRVALAPSSAAASRRGDAQFETAWLRFASVPEQGPASRSMPQLDAAGLVVESLRALTGATAPVEIKHHDHYLDHGVDNGGNPAELLFRLPTEAKTDFGKGTDKVGGFLSPDMAMSALSRLQGPVAGADFGAALNDAGGSFKPEDFFQGLLAAAKLFGTFDLGKIIPIGSLLEAPKFLTQGMDVVRRVLTEVQRWQQIIGQIWDQVRQTLATLESSAAALKDLATEADPLEALTKLLAVFWSAAGKGVVETALASSPVTGVTVPVTFSFDAWKAFLQQVAEKALAQAVGTVAALIEKLVASLVERLVTWVNDLVSTAGAFVKQAIDLLASLWRAWLRAQAMFDLIESLPSMLTGDDPAEAVTAVSTLLGGFTGVLAPIAGKLTPVLGGVKDLADTVKREIETKVAEVKTLFDDIQGEFTTVLEPALKAFALAQDLARNLTFKYAWSTPLKAFGGTATVPLFAPDATLGKLTLAGELRGKEIKGKPAGVDVSASIGKFELNLISPLTFLGLTFDHITFQIKAGKKPDLDVKFNGFVFKGPLAFVENLRKIIPLDGFSDPPSLSITPSGIDASFSLALPPVAIGVFSLTNLSLSAGFSVPFLGAVPLSVRFAFCSRENPFTLTVSLLGGGGFFAIRLNPQGLESMEAALEFGAALSIDLGVASGSVSIMAGVYFKMEGSAVTLTGYLRLRGAVDVLGLITASIELYMSLTYESATGKVIGRASLEIKIKILFVSFGVTVSMEKRFAGSSGDPTFLEVMAHDPAQTIDPWDEYLGAFAAAA